MNNRKEAYINHCIKKRSKHIEHIAKKYLGYDCSVSSLVSKKLLNLGYEIPNEIGFSYHIFINHYSSHNKEGDSGVFIYLRNKMKYEDSDRCDWKKFIKALLKSGLHTFKVYIFDYSWLVNDIEGENE